MKNYNNVLHAIKDNMKFYESDMFQYMNYSEDTIYVECKKDPNIILSIDCSNQKVLAVRRVHNGEYVHHTPPILISVDNDVLPSIDLIMERAFNER